MYKVAYWLKSLVGDAGYAKVEHYFTDSQNALDYYYGCSKFHENRALIVSSDSENVEFMSHYDGDFPDKLKPATFKVNTNFGENA